MNRRKWWIGFNQWSASGVVYCRHGVAAAGEPRIVEIICYGDTL